MKPMYYIGLDVHKRTISYCVKDSSGTIHAEGTIPATRFELVDADVIRFLGASEKKEIKILHCSLYIREWIRRELEESGRE